MLTFVDGAGDGGGVAKRGEGGAAASAATNENLAPHVHRYRIGQSGCACRRIAISCVVQEEVATRLIKRSTAVLASLSIVAENCFQCISTSDRTVVYETRGNPLAIV